MRMNTLLGATSEGVCLAKTLSHTLVPASWLSLRLWLSLSCSCSQLSWTQAGAALDAEPDLLRRTGLRQRAWRSRTVFRRLMFIPSASLLQDPASAQNCTDKQAITQAYIAREMLPRINLPSGAQSSKTRRRHAESGSTRTAEKRALPKLPGPAF